jgi:HD-like signal output (HDOD) protein
LSDFEDADLTRNQHAFGFVQSLAQELMAGKVRLPSSPEAALRLQRALSVEEIDPAVVVSAASAEPALAMRVMRMANSVMLNPMGVEVRDLKTAIARVGYNMVRTAAVAFILEQLRSSQNLDEDTKARLTEVWQESIRVAAISAVIARRHTRINPDVAMLAGLLQGVGKSCILMRFPELPALRKHPETRERILREWHPGVARAVVQSWSMADDVAEAVEACHNLDRELVGAVTLADILTVAVLLAAESAAGEASDLPALVARRAAHFERLGLDARAGAAVVDEAAAQIDSLQSALSG